MIQTQKVGVQIAKVIGMDLGKRSEGKWVGLWHITEATHQQFHPHIGYTSTCSLQKSKYTMG